MSDQLKSTVVKKKPLFKKWWFWVLSVLVLIIIINSLSSGSSTVYELSKAATMSRQEIIEKFGNPNEIIREDSDGYSYGYNAGFCISGTEKGATSIIFSSDMVKKDSSDSYKILDATLDSSFDENVKRLGKPNLSITRDGKKNAVYLTEEGFIFIMSTKYNSDEIGAMELSAYDVSTIALFLDASKMLGSLATEEEIKKVYEIIDKSSDPNTTTYVIEGFNLVVDNQDNSVKTVFITGDSIYNIHGIRVGDTIEKANKIFGNPFNTMEGIKNTTLYVYKYDDVIDVKRVILGIDNESNKIGYIEVSIE